MNGAVTGPLAARPSPWPRPREEDQGPETERDAGRDAGGGQDDFWSAWEWPEPARPDPGRPDPARPEAVPTEASDRSDVAALLPDDLLDGDSGERHWWGRRAPADRHRGAPSAGRGGRRALLAVGSLAVLSGGFLGGVVVDRAVSADALDAARAAAPGGTGTSFAGHVEADTDGALAVVSDDGRRQTVRTSPGTEVVSMNLLSGDLPPGTPVQVRTRTGADGTPEATSVAVTGAPGRAVAPGVSGP